MPTVRKSDENNRSSLQVLLLGVLVAVFSGTWTAGKESLTSQPQQGTTQKDVRTMPGKLLTEGRNTTPVGPYGLLAYRIEKVTLSESGNAEAVGSREQ